MNKHKLIQDLTVMEAVDHLSSLAELDVKSSKGVDEGQVNWLDPKGSDEKRETVKQAFRAINHYLQHLYETDKGRLKDIETQRGVQSIMLLVGEAAQKLDKYTSLFKGNNKKNSVTQEKEYQDLQQYYLTKIMQRFQKSLETEEAWQEEWGNLEEGNLDIQKRGLKDLETVRRDKEYELFYIRRDDGRPFFNRNLLRHIKLVGDFDETLSDPTGEDPLLKLKLIQDREAHSCAKEILNIVGVYIDPFYKEAMRHKDRDFVMHLSKSVMALFLAGNGRNLLQNTMGKSCSSYFYDFQFYLRTALATAEYKKIINLPFEELDGIEHHALNLVYMLSVLFFTRQGDRKEAVALIRKVVDQGKKSSTPLPSKGVGFWNLLTDEDDLFRSLLKHYPNGPLLKTLDAFREGEDGGGFDPLMQDNLPEELFSFVLGKANVSCLRIPCPTRQEVINKAQLNEEFAAFVRSTNTKMAGKKHLLINLQDRTSWQEHARSVLLEQLPRRGEYAPNLAVVTLPKNTEFYLQIESYETLDQAELFMQQLKEQVASGEECGFYFPSFLKAQALGAFVEQAIPCIHRHIFQAKKSLQRTERLDFIEIFYQLLILKCIEVFEPDSMSLTCKDGIDTGTAAAVALYSFLKGICKNPEWTQTEKDHLLWMLYAPALFIRERAIDSGRFLRMTSLLATFYASLEGDRAALLKAFQGLYSSALKVDLLA